MSFVSQLYTIYVKPLITYCSYIYTSSSSKMIDRIENIQKHFTRRLLIRNRLILPYFERLKKCSLEPLEIEFIKLNLITLYKLKTRLITVPSIELKFSYVTRTHLCPRLQITRQNNEYGKSFFLHQASIAWNKLCKNFDLTSLTAFKRSINSCPLSRLCKGRAFKAC